MPVSLVAAVSRGRAIGREGKLPWRLPADLAYFKRLTMGHAVVMGRKTFQSLRKPLSGRRNIVLSRDPSYTARGCVTARSVSEALEAAGREPDEVFVIGGAEVYSSFFGIADRLYITHVDAEFQADAYFPCMDEGEWRLVKSEPGLVDAANPIPHTFAVYERRSM